VLHEISDTVSARRARLGALRRGRSSAIPARPVVHDHRTPALRRCGPLRAALRLNEMRARPARAEPLRRFATLLRAPRWLRSNGPPDAAPLPAHPDSRAEAAG